MLTPRNKFDSQLEISETPTQKDELKNFVNAHLEAAVECIPTKQRVLWEALAVRKKRAVVKIASLHYRRNPTNINTQKFKKAQNELINVYLKEQTINTKSDQ